MRGKNCINKWQHHDREIPNMIRLQQLSHLIGSAVSHREYHDEQDAVQSQVVASFLERGGRQPNRIGQALSISLAAE